MKESKNYEPKVDDKYYMVHVELGHMGTCNGMAVPIYVVAKDIMSAMNYARRLHAVKHHKLMPYAKEITKEEYEIGLARDEYHRAMSRLFHGVEI